ncbi:MAG: hypothetical protein IPP46_19485 [Bacteroidetes bacterium]|nr:hypothetical protein [Bacteroidota bacterium]
MVFIHLYGGGYPFYRLRMLNGSNARVYNLALSNNTDMIIIGNDGGLLKTPSSVKEILIAPENVWMCS